MFPTIALGPFTLRTYTVLINLGVLIALAWLWWRAPAHGREGNRWLDAGLWTTVGAFLGGRLAFVMANWAYFSNHFFETFRLWEGGYAWPGVVLGGVLGLLIYCKPRHEPILPILDTLALPMLLVAALGWVGCAAAACAAGKDVPPGALPFAVNWPDLYGVVLPRWPAQLIGLGLSLIAFGYLFSQRDRAWPRGMRFALSLTLLSLISFLVSTVRGDEMPLVAGQRLDVVASALMVIVGGVAFVAAWALEPANQPKTLSTEQPEIAEKP